MKINNCWASPTNSSQDPIQFNLIQDGCAENEIVKIMENGESSQARFTSEVFGFAGYQKVYLFCDISICFENCIKVSKTTIFDKKSEIQSCLGSENRRKRRAAINDDNQVLSLGPIVINEVENHKDSSILLLNSLAK